MPRRIHPFLPGGTYHLCNRGNNRQVVFRDEADYRFFLQILREYLDITPVDPAQASGATLFACGLMPNHYHMVLRPEDHRLPERMQRLLISCTKTMNARYSRVGALFQGQSQAVQVETDEQLVYLSAYIHRNPLLAGRVRRPQDREYSSYREYSGTRQGTLPSPDSVLELCGGRVGYRSLVEAHQDCRTPGLERILIEE